LGRTGLVQLLELLLGELRGPRVEARGLQLEEHAVELRPREAGHEVAHHLRGEEPGPREEILEHRARQAREDLVREVLGDLGQEGLQRGGVHLHHHRLHLLPIQRGEHHLQLPGLQLGHRRAHLHPRELGQKRGDLLAIKAPAPHAAISSEGAPDTPVKLRGF